MLLTYIKMQVQNFNYTHFITSLTHLDLQTTTLNEKLQ